MPPARSQQCDGRAGAQIERAPSYVQLVTRRHGPAERTKPTFVTALIDITERKRLEHERREAEEARDKLARDREIARARADAKDHFLATLSHELRTPLTPVMATLSDSRLISLAPEPLLGALQTVRRNLDLEVRLIDDLLDVTRISQRSSGPLARSASTSISCCRKSWTCSPTRSGQRGCQRRHGLRGANRLGHRRSDTPASGVLESARERHQIHERRRHA